MKKLIFYLLSFTAAILLLVLIFRSIRTEDLLASLQRMSWHLFLLVILLTAIITFISLIRWRFILAAEGKTGALPTLFESWIASFVMTFITPTLYAGGEFIRAYILKQKSEIAYENGWASIASERLLDATILFFSLIGAFFLLANKIGISTLLTTSLGGSLIFLIFIASLLLFYFKRLKKESIVRPLFQFLIGRPTKLGDFLYKLEALVYETFDFRNRLFQKSVLLSFLKFLFLWLRSYVILLGLTGQASFPIAYLIMISIYIGYLAPTPGALGGQEAAQFIFFQFLGFQPTVGIAYVLILRSLEIMLLLIGLPYLLKWGLHFAGRGILNTFLKKKDGV